MVVDERVQEAIQTAVSLRLIRGPQIILMIMHTVNSVGWRPTELQKLSGHTAASVGMILHDYSKRGIVEKVNLYRDRRSGKYHLTEVGEKKAADLWRAMWRLNDIRPKHYRMPIPH